MALLLSLRTRLLASFRMGMSGSADQLADGCGSTVGKLASNQLTCSRLRVDNPHWLGERDRIYT